MVTVIVALLTGVAATEPAKKPWIEPARDVLVEACGSCHRPNLPTSHPRALAVFNLHDPVWYGGMTDDQLRELRRRIEDSSKIEAIDKHAVISFVDCKVDGACVDATAGE